MQEKMVQPYRAFGEEEQDNALDTFQTWFHPVSFVSRSDRSFGSDRSSYGLPPSASVGMFNQMLVAGVHGPSTRSVSSNESMTNDLNKLAAVGILGEEAPPQAGHARSMCLKPSVTW